MLLWIGLEIVLAVATWAFSGFFWPLLKRHLLLKKLVHDHNFLESLNRDVLSSPPQSVTPYADKHPQGYAFSMLLLVESDKRTIRRLQIQFGVPLVVLLVASYFLGPVYLLINLAISRSSRPSLSASPGVPALWRRSWR